MVELGTSRQGHVCTHAGVRAATRSQPRWQAGPGRDLAGVEGKGVLDEGNSRDIACRAESVPEMWRCRKKPVWPEIIGMRLERRQPARSEWPGKDLNSPCGCCTDSSPGDDSEGQKWGAQLP